MDIAIAVGAAFVTGCVVVALAVMRAASIDNQQRPRPAATTGAEQYADPVAELRAARQAREEFQLLWGDLDAFDLTAAAAHRLRRILDRWDQAGESPR